MRTTLNIDDELLERVTSRFPPGTPKTVIIEESLRLALGESTGPERARAVPGIQLAPDVAALVAKGVLAPPTRAGVPPQGLSPQLPPGALLQDLERDREDR